MFLYAVLYSGCSDVDLDVDGKGTISSSVATH